MSIFKHLWPFKKKKQPSLEEEIKQQSLPVKRALCVGINNYPGTQNDLNGCVNDAREWAYILKSKYGFSEISTLFDSAATASNIKKNLEAILMKSKNGDNVAFTYSGHGTTVLDTDGDEADKYDEALYCYDTIIRDDELRDIISKMPKGVKFTVISDSCHSGTVTRALLAQKAISKKAGRRPPTPRYMPPQIEIKSMKKATKKREFLRENDMVEVLLTGCKSTESSYDANINGKNMGAMSANAIDILKSNRNENLTWNQFFAELRKRLPSERFPQTPQLEASEANKNKPLFS